MDRAKLEQAYQKVDFMRRALLETRKRLEGQKADMVALYGDNTPLVVCYNQDIAHVDDLVKTIHDYIGKCDDGKIMELIYDIMADEKSLLDERFTETKKASKVKAVRKRIEKSWKKIKKIEEKNAKKKGEVRA